MIVLLLYVLIVLLTTFIELVTSVNHPILFPSDIYEYTKLNWFGSWFLYILLAIFSPIIFISKWILMGIINLCLGIKWLFTVGRDNDNTED